MKKMNMPDAPQLAVDANLVIEILTGFLVDAFEKTGAQKAIIGLSGGLDSAVVAMLAAKALGLERVLGVMLPYSASSQASRDDADLLAKVAGIKTELVDITPMVDSFFEKFPEADDMRRGNCMARQRMIVLYDISARDGGLVIGTSNKSEIMLGYGTIFGDLACAVNPIGDLYKTQIRQIAKTLGVPDKIIDKPPTADLCTGQTDESDLGFTYTDADKLLFKMVDEGCGFDELQDFGFEPEFIEEVYSRVQRNHFKRIPPLIAKVSGKTVGHEFRYAWDWSNI